MIKRDLLLRESLDIYAVKLRVSAEPVDQETYEQDYLNDDEWTALQLLEYEEVTCLAGFLQLVVQLILQ